MSDIVERLRELPDNKLCWVGKVGAEAADEIERLRELLQEARGHIDHIRWHGFPDNTSAPGAKEKAAQLVEKIDLALTDEQGK